MQHIGLPGALFQQLLAGSTHATAMTCAHSAAAIASFGSNGVLLQWQDSLSASSRAKYKTVQEQYPWPDPAWASKMIGEAPAEMCACDARQSEVLSWMFDRIDCVTLARIKVIRRSAVLELNKLKKAGHQVIIRVTPASSCGQLAVECSTQTHR